MLVALFTHLALQERGEQALASPCTTLLFSRQSAQKPCLVAKAKVGLAGGA